MSWIDQCRVAFKQQADAMYWHGKLDKKLVINKLSIESGIPKVVLWKWWKRNGFDLGSVDPIFCIKCKEKHVYRKTPKGNYYKEKSIYYGLCGSCKSKLERKRRKNGTT